MSQYLARMQNVLTEALTKPREVLLLLRFAAVLVDRVHDQGRLDGHGRPVTRVDSRRKGASEITLWTQLLLYIPFHFTGNKAICYAAHTGAVVPLDSRPKETERTHGRQDIAAELYTVFVPYKFKSQKD